MTDAHCHVSCGDKSVRELLVGRDFFGVHPWETLIDPKPTLCDSNFQETLLALRLRLLANPRSGVGEIGLDRLKVRDIPPLMREVFKSQLSLALELRRPVVLHGAKCWGQVVAEVKKMIGGGLATCDVRQAFLFHGFSRSDGLIPEIVKLNGFISVGPAVLNDHAVNYRELVKKIPLDRLLVETDAVAGDSCDRTSSPERSAGTVRPLIYDVLEKTAALRGISAAELEKTTDENTDRFLGVA